MRFLILLGLVSMLGSAPSGLPKPGPNMQAWVPVYALKATARKVSFEAPRPIVTSGKIYTIGNYLLQVEKDSGIHVIDYSNRSLPKKIGFLRSLFCSEMAIKGQRLYINNLDDLVVVNISDITNPVEVARIPAAFPLPGGEFPPQQGVFFVCPDPAKGEVIGWQQQIVDYPKCYR